MAINAKRFGLEVQGDLEVETRLRRIETYIDRLLSVVDISTDASTSTQRVVNVPQVTGLRVLGKTPGAITLAWNQIRISDLRRYELDVAEDLAFTENKQTYNVAGTEYQFSTVASEGGGGTTVYARVRARSRSSVGPYSVTVNTTTGQAQSADIADNAVTIEKIYAEQASASQTQQGIVELATDAEAAASTDITRAVVPANLAQFNLDYPAYDDTSQDGYFEVVGAGILVQFMVITAGAPWQYDLPTSFADANYTVVASATHSDGQEIAVAPVDANTVQVYVEDNTPARTVHIIAIGNKPS